MSSRCKCARPTGACAGTSASRNSGVSSDHISFSFSIGIRVSISRLCELAALLEYEPLNHGFKISLDTGTHFLKQLSVSFESLLRFFFFRPPRSTPFFVSSASARGVTPRRGLVLQRGTLDQARLPDAGICTARRTFGKVGAGERSPGLQLATQLVEAPGPASGQPRPRPPEPRPPGAVAAGCRCPRGTRTDRSFFDCAFIC
jgi:hypothetical protein